MVGTVLGVEDALLLFRRWHLSKSTITCAFNGTPGLSTLEIQLLGNIEYVGPGVIKVCALDNSAFLRIPANSVHAYHYCEAQDMETDSKSKFVAFLIVVFMDGTFIRFGEMALEGGDIPSSYVN